jgi:putative FmdB family regulatory protein
MPIYDYLCRECGHEFEGLVLKELEIPDCPSCDGKDLEQLLSMPSVHSEARKQRSMRAARKRDGAQAKEREYTQRQYELNHDD